MTTNSAWTTELKCTAVYSIKPTFQMCHLLSLTGKVKSTIKGPESRTKNGYKSGPDDYKSGHKIPFNADKRLEG